MNLKNFLKTLLMLAAFTAFVSSATFAKTWYVSNTNGNDIVFPGTQAQPFQTIGKAIASATSGDIISIEADTYNEGGAQLVVAENLTFVSTTFNNLSTVTISNGIEINGANKTVNFGRAADGSQKFLLQDGAANALLLTAGTVNIDANTTIASGALVIRTAGVLNGSPTTTNVNVTYNGGANVTAGGELPSSLGTGTLTVGITAGKTLTVGSQVSLKNAGQIIVNTGNVNFTSVTFDYSAGQVLNAIENNGADAVAFSGAVNFNRTGGASTITLLNNAGGKLNFNGGVANNNSSNITLKLTNAAAGSIALAGGSINGDVTNDNGGTIELTGNSTFAADVSNNNAASLIKLNSNQLTLSGGTVTNAGKVISATAGTVGTGLMAVTGAVALNGGGDVTGVSVSGGGALTFGANTTLFGNFNIVSGTVADGGNIVSVKGDFVRTDNTPGNYTSTGTLDFSGTGAQGFNPGASLKLQNLTVNKTVNTVVTMMASVEVTGDVTINSGNLNLADYNINLTGGNPNTFKNTGNFYSTTGNGYLVFLGTTGALDGNGSFGNILINTTAGGDVSASSAIKFSGTLVLYNGNLAMGGNNFTLTSDHVTHPAIRRKVDPTNVGTALITFGGGVFNVNSGVTYNLEYFGSGSANASGEWSNGAASINDLWVNVTGGNTITGPALASNIDGNLKVNAGQTLDLNAQIATLSGNNAAHMVPGTVTNGTLNETGSGATLAGSTVAADAATINVLTVAAGAGNSFTANNLKVINGKITVTNGDAVLNMNSTTATVTGDVQVDAGSLDLNMASTASTHTGDVVVNGGTLTYTRGGTAAQQILTGTVTLNNGTMMLGSNVSVTGQTTVAAGGLDLQSYNYTQQGSAATPDFNRTGAGAVTGTGWLVLDATNAALDLTPGSSLTVPNLKFVDGGPNGITLNGAMEVTNALTHTSGAVDLNTLTLSGNTYTYTAGTYPSGTLIFTGNAAVATLSGSVTIPNVTVNAPSGSLTIASSNSTVRTLTVSNVLTQTDGDINLGKNILELTGGAGAFVRAAGNWTMSSGYVEFANAALTFDPGTGWAVDNLEVSAAAANSTSNAWTVNKNLVLGGALQTATPAADNKLVLGDGVLVERQANVAKIDKKVTFGATVNLLYSTSGPITLGNEIPSTDIINNMTVTGASSVVMNNSQNVTINGTLSLAGPIDATTAAPDGSVTMADGSTLELKANGLAVLDKDLVRAGALHIVYNGANATSTRELGSISSGFHTALTGDVTVKTAVALDAGVNFGGTLTLGANINQTAANFTVNVYGDLVQSAANAFFVNQSAAVNFAGTTTDLKLKADQQIPANLMFTMNKADIGDSLMLSGGDLDFATNSAVLYLKKGVLVTGDNMVVLKQSKNGANQPTQGFNKTGVSYIIGNVQKYIDNTKPVDISIVQFPVGTPDGNYRQLDYYFKTAPQSSINLTVSAASVSPGGANGFPISAGPLTLTNYPDFYWYVKSDVSLNPSYKYDMDAQAQGYTDYLTDQIQNVRFVRRDSGNVNNPWIMQGGIYDNSTIATDWPVVKVIDATGGVTTQGSIFAYSQLNKAPNFTAALNDTTVNEGDTLKTTYTAVDPDLNQTATLSSVALPTGATFDPATGKFSWAIDYTQAGTHTVTIRATDNLGLYRDTTVTITVNNVNRAPQFTKVLSDTTVKDGQLLSFTYTATDIDSDPLKYRLNPITPAFAGTASIDSLTGVLSLTPAFADAGKTFTVVATVSDGIATTAATAAMVTVKHARKLGDVDSNGVVQAYDASKVLQEVVGLIPAFTPGTEDFWAADVNQDGEVGSFDASWILFAAVNDTFPNGVMPKSGAVKGEIVFGDMQPNEDNSNIVNIPVKLANANNILSSYVELNIDSKYADVEKVSSNLPEGWLSFNNYANGKLKIVMSGINPLTNGEVAVISLKLKDKEAKFTVNGSYSFNDNVNSTLSDLSVKQIPTQFELSQNYPNPFNPTTKIKYQLAGNSKVNITIYNTLGQRVKTLVNGIQESGYYTIEWDGTNNFGQKVTSGVYIYRMEAGSFVKIHKMNLLK